MVEYKCNKCNKIFRRKSHYDYHINRKTPCKNDKMTENNNNTIAADNQQNAAKCHQVAADNQQNAPKCQQFSSVEAQINDKQCQYCKKIFTRVSSLNVHLKNRCKIKKHQDEEKEDLLQKLIKEKEEQNKIIEELRKQTKEIAEMKQIICRLESENKKYTQKIGTQNNIEKQQNNIMMNNVKLLAFGKEDMSHLADEVCKKILNKGFKSVPTLVEHVHFNKNKPENHNVYISNIQTNYALVFDGIDWKLKERDGVLQQLVDDKTAVLSDKFDELLVKLDEPTIRKFQRFLDQKDDDTVISGIKNDLKLLLYNNKKIPERTRELFASYSDNSKMIEVE